MSSANPIHYVFESLGDIEEAIDQGLTIFAEDGTKLDPLVIAKGVVKFTKNDLFEVAHERYLMALVHSERCYTIEPIISSLW